MRPRLRAPLLTALTALAAIAAGCSVDNTEPVALSGTYELESINGDLPGVAYNSGGVTLEITHGLIEFSSGGSVVLTEGRHYRCPQCTSGSTDDTTSLVAAGVYSIAGNVVVLSRRRPGGAMVVDTGIVSANTLSFPHRSLDFAAGSDTVRARTVYVRR